MFAQTFTFGELWTSGDEWRCEIEGCEEKSSTIGLTQEEVQKVAEALPNSLTHYADGPSLSGPEAAAYILENKLGKVVCSNHETASEA